ncbi:MAG: alginate lyase family protein [Anaerolineales bacterium]
MLNNFRNLNSLYRSLGPRWLMFRVAYALRMRTGLLRRQIPAFNWHDRPLESWLKKDIPSKAEAYAEWRRQHSRRFFFEKTSIPDGVHWDAQLAVQEAERILNGELKYFSHKFLKTGFPPDWHRDPVSGVKLEASKHWSEISNEGDVDIKFIWEASRFSMVYPLVRAYAARRDERLAEAFWELVQAWAESNPPNLGPNWMDGQEAALRLLAWTFGFYAFMDSPSTTPERIAQFTVLAAAHAERIYLNIDYAISTQSNHTISEAFGLWLAGILFPELEEAQKYFSLGCKLLEQESAAQIFPDGSYAMYSLNYQRFILQIYFCAIRLGELNGSPFSEALKRRVSKAVDYLYQLIDPETGQMPVYGSNDGALVLPLNNCDFTDYRPLLQLGAWLTKRKLLFDPGSWDEDIFWLCGEEFPAKSAKRALNPRDLRGDSFPDGGTYLLRGANSKAVIRCTDFRARPSHADQLHVDLWRRGVNIACDAGTYLYGGEDIRWRNGLAHTSAHNTVTVDRQDQMKMFSRFLWTGWAKGKVLRHEEKTWQGEHNGYRRRADPVNHKRTVLSLSGDRWLVVDHLDGNRPHHYSLHWLFCDGEYGVQELTPANFGISLDIPGSKLPDSTVVIRMGLLEGNASFSIVRGDENSTRGWRSRYYGDKEPAISAVLETDRPRACFWTYFGFEGDAVKLNGEILEINSTDWETSVNLAALNG